MKLLSSTATRWPGLRRLRFDHTLKVRGSQILMPVPFRYVAERLQA